MSCSEGGSAGLKRYPGTGCCGSSCVGEVTGCLASEPRIRSCFCQENVGCIDRADCGGFRPRGTAATGACPGPCQCAEEEAWNRNAPPKPNCEWLSNFSELRRQWSDHARQNNCKCCNCKPCRTAAPCKPCLPPVDKSVKVLTFAENSQSCCNDRLSGGANSSCCQRDNKSPSAMPSSGRYSPPPSYNDTNSSGCCSPGGNAASSPYDDEKEVSESMCKPCSPSPRPILKERSCCQCIPGYCMCQPMPRTCNCPPPVQVDARAARDCECECPSSPECACPPSERRFPRTKVKCPNARMCCSTPRPQPGPKCSCTKCQPCLPPPCDPCTSSKCRTETPKVAACGGGSPCDDNSPCRPETPKLSACRPTPPCNECRKMAPPCRPPMQVENFRQSTRQLTGFNQPRTTESKCSKTSGTFRSDKGYGDDNGDMETGCQEAQQCHCGSSGSRGWDELSENCCSVNCDEDVFVQLPKGDKNQCGCGGVTEEKKLICHNNCDYCCSMNCDSEKPFYSGGKKMFTGLKKRVRMAAGGPYDWSVLENQFSASNESLRESYYQKNFPTNVEEFTSTTSLESNVKCTDESTQAKLQEDAVPGCNSCAPKASVVSAVAAPSPRSPCKLLRSLIRAKSSVKYYK